jgi:hypothetical protein
VFPPEALALLARLLTPALQVPSPTCNQAHHSCRQNRGLLATSSFILVIGEVPRLTVHAAALLGPGMRQWCIMYFGKLAGHHFGKDSLGSGVLETQWTYKGLED